MLIAKEEIENEFSDLMDRICNKTDDFSRSFCDYCPFAVTGTEECALRRVAFNLEANILQPFLEDEEKYVVDFEQLAKEVSNV